MVISDALCTLACAGLIASVFAVNHCGVDPHVSERLLATWTTLSAKCTGELCLKTCILSTALFDPYAYILSSCFATLFTAKLAFVERSKNYRGVLSLQLILHKYAGCHIFQ